MKTVSGITVDNQSDVPRRQTSAGRQVVNAALVIGTAPLRRGGAEWKGSRGIYG